MSQPDMSALPWPIIPESVSVPRPPAANPTPTVLVIDDDEHVRAAMHRVLHRAGFDVVTAPDGRGALDLCSRTQPSVVLLDLQMPGPDGISVCLQIKSHPPTRLTPVVLMTGASERANRLRGIEAGADEFLSKPVDTAELIARVRALARLKQHTDQLESAEAILLSLARGIEGKDPFTHGHCERLSVWSTRLAQVVGLCDADVHALRQGGILHDIGKIGVPDAVLLKTSSLAPDEWELMKQHPVIGDYICRPLRSFSSVLPIVRHHHERLDGTGYPDGIGGEEIAVTARVLQVVDIYDAVRSARPYKQPLTHADAVSILTRETEKGWRDRDVVSAFLSMLEAPAVEGDGEGTGRTVAESWFD